jgi:hypothetical protein
VLSGASAAQSSTAAAKGATRTMMLPKLLTNATHFAVCAPCSLTLSVNFWHAARKSTHA